MALSHAGNVVEFRPHGGCERPADPSVHAHLDIFLDRDPAFWDGVANHPEVAPHVFLGQQGLSFMECVSHPSVTPLRAKHGGFIFAKLDGLGRVYELHTLFTPEGWGREVFIAARQAFNRIFDQGAQVIVTYEVEGWWRSRPPKTFRFAPAGDFEPAPPEYGVNLRTWILTREAWEKSPARGRM